MCATNWLAVCRAVTFGAICIAAVLSGCGTVNIDQLGVGGVGGETGGTGIANNPGEQNPDNGQNTGGGSGGGSGGTGGALYASDFSSSPGWTTNAPGQCYWDSARGRYHIEGWDAGDQYAYVRLPSSVASSFKLEFDVEVIEIQWGGQVVFGLFDSDMNVNQSSACYVYYAQGDGGRGAGVAFFTQTESGNTGGGYDFLYELNERHHNTLTYDAGSGTLSWRVVRGRDGAVVADQARTGLPSLGQFDRLAASWVGDSTYAGAKGAAYLDNVILSRLP
jgi:hypothetical protein